MPLTIFKQTQNNVDSLINPSRWIKYVFLSFTQAVFSNYAEFLFSTDRTQTLILIQDKYVSTPINSEKLPQVIFNRGPLNYGKTSLDQVISGNVNNLLPQNKTDMIRASGSFSCIAKDQVTSEHIADIIATAVFLFRGQFKEKGINEINTVSTGESSPIKMQVAGNKVDMFNTPVYVSFNCQYQWVANADFDGILNSEIDLVLSGFPINGIAGSGEELLEIIGS